METAIHIASYLTEAAPRPGPLFTCEGAETTLPTARRRVLALARAIRHDLHAEVRHARDLKD